MLFRASWLAALVGLAAAVLPVAEAQAQAVAPPAPPDTEIFLAPLTIVGGRLTVGEPVNITNSPGYDNQPSFTPDGQAIIFASVRGGGRLPDIYRYDIRTALTGRVTQTPEGEYSPTVTPDGRHISVVRVEADGTQRLWQFGLDGRHPEIVLTTVKPVGYHVWVDDHTLVLFVLGQPPTLQIADTVTGTSRIVATNIGRSLQHIPGAGTISFVERQVPSEGSGPPALWIRELDPRTRQVTPLVRVMAGATEADCVWTPDGMLLMAQGGSLYGWRRGGFSWNRIANLDALGLRGVTRLAVSPKGDRIALVAQPR
jgi:dipeptidyl aminopeptidase/acylaminoacyl peptidase